MDGLKRWQAVPLLALALAAASGALGWALDEKSEQKQYLYVSVALPAQARLQYRDEKAADAAVREHLNLNDIYRWSLENDFDTPGATGSKQTSSVTKQS